jgi:hypothetical protein
LDKIQAKRLSESRFCEIKNSNEILKHYSNRENRLHFLNEIVNKIFIMIELSIIIIKIKIISFLIYLIKFYQLDISKF